MSFKFSENHVSNFTSFWPYFLKTLAMSFVSHIFTWISSSKQSFLRYLPTFGLKFSWKRPKTLIFGRYFCDILCDISVKWAKKRAIFFCDCDMEKNPCDTLFFKLYHIAPALRFTPLKRLLHVSANGPPKWLLQTYQCAFSEFWDFLGVLASFEAENRSKIAIFQNIFFKIT